ncbi:hypothetical protein SIM91_00340 [Rhodococcus opacus]|nr:hypothetical protein [Rhodococcus opacus]
MPVPDSSAANMDLPLSAGLLPVVDAHRVGRMPRIAEEITDDHDALAGVRYRRWGRS